MPLLGLLKKKIKHISILVTREELKSVMALTVLDPPQGARYKVGDTIHTDGVSSTVGNMKVYGIKAGGYGVAYIVLDEETLTPYCLKTFRDRFSKDPEVVKQFTRESETWIRLGKHPNLIFAHSVLEIGGRHHILFEYAARSDLWRQIKKGPIPIKMTLKYAVQFCRGMVYAQTRLPGFVHGDIKPSNCLLMQDGTLKIADFGQVDSWETSEELPRVPSSDETSSSYSQTLDSQIFNWRVGTPSYMAPEQFNLRNRIDARSDVYSFGVMLFEMLTGVRPFKGESHRECFAEHTNTVPPDPVSLNPEIPEPLARLILNCLAKSPTERPENFALLENEVSSILWRGYQERVPLSAGIDLSDEELTNRGTSLIALGHHEEALAYFDDLLSRIPTLAGLWSHKGDALSGLQRHEQALGCYNQSLELDQRLALVWTRKGETLSKLGRDQEAIACFDRALELNSRLAFAWSSKGQTFTNLGNPQAGLKCLKRALQIDPLNFLSYYSLGVALSRLEREEEAIASFKQATDLNSEYAEAHCELGNAYLQMGRLKEAIESYTQAIRVNPGYEEARSRLITTYYRFYSSSRQFISEAFAESMFTFLMDESQDSDEVVRRAGNFLKLSNFDSKIFYLFAGKLFTAIKRANKPQRELLASISDTIRKAIAPPEEDRSDFYWLGKIYYGLQRYDECVGVFKKSISLFGPDDKAYYYVAACNEVSGNYQAALNYYRQALMLDPKCRLTRGGIKRAEAQVALASTLITK